MSRPLRCVRSALLAATFLAPVAARAQGVTPDQATQLQQQLRGWLATLLGPKVPLGDRPIQVTAEGDHFRLAVDVAGPISGTPITVASGPITATVKQIDATHWSIDDLGIHSALRIDNAEPGDSGLKSISIQSEAQASHGEFDTAAMALTSSDSSTKGYSSAIEEVGGRRITSIATMMSHTVSEPAPGGGLNLKTDSRGEKLASEGMLPDGTPFRFTVDKVAFNGHADAVAFDQIGPMIRGVMSMIPDAPQPVKKAAVEAAPRTAKGNPEVAANAKLALNDALKLKPPARPASAANTPRAAAPVTPPVAIPAPTPVEAKNTDMTPAQKATAHQLLASLRGFMGGLQEDLAFNGIRVESSGHFVTFDDMAFGMGFGAPGGRMEVHLAMSVDGLNSPDVPPGVMRTYLPTHIALKPRVSGIPADDVFALANHAIDTDAKDQDALGAEALGLLAKGPLSMGIDDLALVMGPASLKGGGEVTMASITDIKGKATFTATGLDDLIKQVNTVPEFKNMGAGPVLLLVKGMGRTEGQNVVWDVTYADGKVMVNDTDLSAMIPTGK